MGSLGTALVCLVQFRALQGATGLNVQQGFKLLQVRQDRQVTLTCQVVQPQAWEQLHVKWTKASVAFCPPCVTNSNLSLEMGGLQGWLFWWPPGILTLQLDCVGLHSSGNYLCWTTMVMAESVEAKGNGTQLLVGQVAHYRWNQISGFPGFFMLLVAGEHHHRTGFLAVEPQPAGAQGYR